MLSQFKSLDGERNTVVSQWFSTLLFYSHSRSLYTQCCLYISHISWFSRCIIEIRRCKWACNVQQHDMSTNLCCRCHHVTDYVNVAALDVEQWTIFKVRLVWDVSKALVAFDLVTGQSGDVDSGLPFPPQADWLRCEHSAKLILSPVICKVYARLSRKIWYFPVFANKSTCPEINHILDIVNSPL